jgi:hypothetical protein
MKLLLLLPNFVLLAISGYNLSIEFFTPGVNGTIVVTLMHLLVMAICLTFIGIIVKSMFTIKYIEVIEEEADDAQDYKKINLHSA